MSKTSTSNDQISGLKITFSAIAMISVILLFLFILLVVYIPNRHTPVDQEIVAQRKARLSELKAKEADIVNSYGWIDQSTGITHIPVDAAMELVVQSYQSTSSVQPFSNSKR